MREQKKYCYLSQRYFNILTTMAFHVTLVKILHKSMLFIRKLGVQNSMNFTKYLAQNTTCMLLFYLHSILNQRNELKSVVEVCMKFI